MEHDRLCACADCTSVRAARVNFASVDEALARLTELDMDWNAGVEHDGEEGSNIAAWLHERHIAIGFDEAGNAVAQ